MSLWCLLPSPLMLGMNLPDNDEATLALITNDEVLAIDQDPLGKPAHLVSSREGLEVWIRDVSNGAKIIGLFNRSAFPAAVTLNWNEAGLNGKENLRNVWEHKDLGAFDAAFPCQVPSHGAVLLRAASPDQPE